LHIISQECTYFTLLYKIGDWNRIWYKIGVSTVSYTSVTQTIKKLSAQHVKDRENKCFQQRLKFLGIYP
jgi:hypothetical protein